MKKNLDRDVILGFVEEAKGYLPKIKSNLDSFYKDPEQMDCLAEAHRLVHSIKGASSMVGLGSLSHMAYFMEESLEEIGAGQNVFDGDARLLFNTTLSRIEQYLDGTQANKLDPAPLLKDVVKNFRRWRGLPEKDDETVISGLLGSEEATPAATAQPAEPSPKSAAAPRMPVAEENDVSADILEAFFVEAADHLQTISGLLVVLEKNPSKEDCLTDLRRSVHTIKGAAAVVGFGDISRLAHRMEDLLDGLAEKDKGLTGDHLDLLFRSTDCLEDLVRNEGQGSQKELKELLGFFDNLVGTAPAAELPAPTSNLEISLAEEEVIDLTDFTPEGQVPGEQESDDTKTVPAKTGEMVRVPLERLDELVHLVSELVINRSTFEQYFGKLGSEVEELHPSISRLKRVSTSFETQFEAASLGGKLFGSSSMKNLTGPSPASSADEAFDDLEMDRYTDFHILSRELAESASDINTVGTELKDVIRDFDGYLVQSSRLTSQVQDRLMRLRMVPLALLSTRLHRTVRVTANKQEKQVELRIEGEGVELDKSVFEELIDPMLHIMRNAVDHGIEPPALRQVMGKPQCGKISVEAFYAGTQVVIRIKDDGAGIDPDIIRNKALEAGYFSQEELAELKERDLFELLFLPGFSTAETVSEISGRGVGMDVVKSKVEAMKGLVSLESAPSVGTTLTIKLPLTLAITRVILVHAHQELFAIPLNGVRKILRVEKGAIETAGREPVINVDGTYYPVVRLGSALNLIKPADPNVTRHPVLILDLGEKQIALVVDKLSEAKEVVVKSMGHHLKRVRGVSGATLMGDGRVVLILNPNELSGEAETIEVKPQMKIAPKPKTKKQAEVMVVDDSLSVRRVLTNIVKNAGLQTKTARDGVEAFEMIQKSNNNPDVMLLDIEMPRMNGYELTNLLRSQKDYQNIPIIMLTSRSGEKHRKKAYDLGVNEYLVKPFQEESLLNLIQKFVNRVPGPVAS